MKKEHGLIDLANDPKEYLDHCVVTKMITLKNVSIRLLENKNNLC